MADDRTATLYRMVLPDHECPFGVRAKEMLEQSDYQLDEHILKSRDEVEAFKAEHGVATTPQVFIGGKRIGGSSDLAAFLEEEHSRAS
ncbi:glutaredoxin domain-containing protein [Sphingomonas sp.]|uniref:glutaredoxin domain-containing protein n=1 Tax=Sphingomonas sp. TaxID=28214 RepID=UPI00286EA232|nr:glutaredoxin domain-containing protein [Sphingomonas sp.]